MKKDVNTKKSRGFGFVRYGDRAIQASVFEAPSHTIKGRRLELKYPKQVKGWHKLSAHFSWSILSLEGILLLLTGILGDEALLLFLSIFLFD